jgi:hypothetical protein
MRIHRPGVDAALRSSRPVTIRKGSTYSGIALVRGLASSSTAEGGTPCWCSVPALLVPDTPQRIVFPPIWYNVPGIRSAPITRSSKSNIGRPLYLGGLP